MRLTFVEYGVIAAIIVIVLIIVFCPPNNSIKDIQPTTLYSTVEYHGHTYIENFRADTIIHNPDCTNSKCFKE